MFLLHPTPNVAIDDKEFDTQLYETAPSPLVKYDVGSGIIGAIVTDEKSCAGATSLRPKNAVVHNMRPVFVTDVAFPTNQTPSN